MAFEFINTDQNSTYDMDAGDDIVLAQNTTVSSSGIGMRAFGSDNEITLGIHGSVFSVLTAVALQGNVGAGTTGTNVGDNVLYIGETGVVHSLSGIGVFIYGTDAKVTNYGQIAAENGGILANSDGAVIENHGAIRVSVDPDSVNIDEGIDLQSATGPASVLNTGTISAEHGVQSASLSLTFRNTGTIMGTELALSFSNSSSTNAMFNFGELFGGIDVNGIMEFINGGLVEGDITSGTKSDRLNNTGTIAGDVDLDDAADTLINRGTITGNASLGTGADVYRGFGGRVEGVIDGGEDADMYFTDQADARFNDSGTTGSDSLFARADVLDVEGIENITLRGSDDYEVIADSISNVIVGNAGNNQIQGLGGADTISGRGGDDILEGGAGSDVILGGAGNDMLQGGDADDNLRGGTGDDTLIGGAGKDTYRGEIGADTLVWTAVANMSTGTSNVDVVQGFERGVDVLDVSAINLDDSFAFLGTGVFTASGDMEVRYFVNGAGHAIVQFDENGDGAEDGRIVVRDASVLSADDFLL